MLRSDLRDGAVAAAKGFGHEEVAPRHVAYAIARQFKDRPGIAEMLPLAKAALEPRGNSVATPKVNAEAESLLESIANESEALAALKRTLEPGTETGSKAAGPRPSLEVATGPAVQAAEPAKATPPPAKENPADILAELDSYIGLGSVKTQVRSIVAVVQANETRKQSGLAPVSGGLHLVFTGPPGTGKTTVARIIARLYAATGALPGNNFTEATRTDLVAGYVGQTAIKTSELIAKTRPGVLFIDEAYALTPRHESDFGAEAIATLVKAMEDHRKEFAVIVAGYGEEMNDFVSSNPGLRSRFKTFVDFPDYAPGDLVQIFARFAKESGLDLHPGVPDKAAGIFQQAVGKREFGNARFARSLFEQAYARMAARAAADGTITVDEITCLLPEDLEFQASAFEPERRRIGFGDSGTKA